MRIILKDLTRIITVGQIVPRKLSLLYTYHGKEGGTYVGTVALCKVLRIEI